MKSFRVFALTTLLVLAGAVGSQAVQPPSRHITMHIPVEVIETALAQTLPLTFESESDKLEGTITVVSISNLKLSDKTVLCHLELQGHNLHLVSMVANQIIRLKLGDARIDFDCQTQLRYSPEQKTLFLRPVAQGVQAEQALQDGDIGQALLMLLNGREFAVELQDIQPIIAEASNKTIAITPHIADITTVPGAVQIKLLPDVKAFKK